MNEDYNPELAITESDLPWWLKWWVKELNGQVLIIKLVNI
jgi:hypothetical protein